MLSKPLINNKKIAVLCSAATFPFALLHAAALDSEERESLKMDILCQTINSNINLQINNQSDNKQMLKLTSNTHNHFTTRINKYSQINLNLAKEQFPIQISSPDQDKNDLIIDENCQFTR